MFGTRVNLWTYLWFPETLAATILSHGDWAAFKKTFQNITTQNLLKTGQQIYVSHL